MKELKQLLLRNVGQQLEPFGFHPKPSGQSFSRPFSGGRVSFHLGFVSHPHDFDVTADLAVRFDPLEDLVNERNSQLTKKEKSQTSSLGAEIGNLAGVGQMRWKVKDAADVPARAHEIVEAFKMYGVSYLARASTMQGAFELLTAPGRAAWLHSPFHSARAKRVLGLAKLLGREDEIPALIDANARFMMGLNDSGLQDFERFAAQLVPSIAARTSR
jgi:hypothetical protein